ncbi:MAG TPA: LLM class flavin-dependent oxidoreductase [Solirubrobacterales bacterium]|nr:LLM class flavin-dependent oxidoreductase [Solirubrobacterales bacterium]
MKFGIVILPEYRWTEAQHLWRRAEDYGFDHAWTYDHLGWRDLVDGPWFDAVPTLAAAALVTSRIKLGTHVASANHRHPAAFAREITALDDISDGRFLLGVGAGGKGFDAAVLGRAELTGRERVDRFIEFVSLLDRILTNTSTTVEGRYFSAVDARSAPGSVQRPRVPYIVAANAPRSISLAAQYGDGWITTGAQTDDLGSWWSSVAQNCARFEEELAAQGRSAQDAARYLSLDAAPVYSLSSVETFSDFVGRSQELGFTDVVSHWPRASGWYAGQEGILEEIADTYLESAR